MVAFPKITHRLGRLVATAVSCGVALGLAAPVAAGAEPAPFPVRGGDVSWPNCPKGLGIPKRRTLGLPMPIAAAKFVIIGLTNGPGFYPNPCIDRQVEWAKKRNVYVGAYAMTTFPKKSQLRKYATAGPYPTDTAIGRVRNAGYAEAMFNVDTMRRLKLDVPFVWVDIEEYPVAPWPGNTKRNRAIVDGVLRAYTDSGYEVGFYTSPGPYQRILGGKRYGLPEWRTAGGPPYSNTTVRSARRMCSATPVQGGRAVMAQWWDTKRDHDIVCPAFRTPAALDNFFYRYPQQ